MEMMLIKSLSVAICNRLQISLYAHLFLNQLNATRCFTCLIYWQLSDLPPLIELISQADQGWMTCNPRLVGWALSFKSLIPVIETKKLSLDRISC